MTVRQEKRRNRDGTFREIYIADVCVEPPQGGAPVRDRKSFKAKRLAEQWENRRRAELLTGRGIVAAPPPAVEKPLAPTLREFSAEWLRVYVTANCRGATYDAREFQLAHVLPMLGNTRLDELTLESVEKLKAALLLDGCAASSVNIYLGCLAACLSVAREWGRPVASVKIRKIKTPPPHDNMLDDAEVERMFAVDDSLTTVGLESGLRISELRALQLVDVDFRGESMNVCRSFDNKDQLCPPKSGRNRVIPLSSRALAALRGERHLRGPWVWCQEDGTHLTRDAATWRVTRACHLARVREVSPHVLRHTFASRLVQRNVSLRTIQELLGHSTIEQTMRYAHLGPNSAREAIRQLNGNLTATHLSVVTSAR